MNRKREKSTITRITPGFERLAAPHAALAEHFAGRERDTVYNCAGCRVELDTVLLRTYRADPYRLCIRLGNEWVEVAKVQPDDPALAELDITEYGKTPTQIEEDRRKAEAERKRIEDEQAVQEERRQAHIERLRREQGKDEQRRESRRREYGLG